MSWYFVLQRTRGLQCCSVRSRAVVAHEGGGEAQSCHCSRCSPLELAWLGRQRYVSPSHLHTRTTPCAVQCPGSSAHTHRQPPDQHHPTESIYVRLATGTFDPFGPRNIPLAAEYMVNWVRGAAQVHGLTIAVVGPCDGPGHAPRWLLPPLPPGYTGIWNEDSFSRDYTVVLRASLDEAGFDDVRIIIYDGPWPSDVAHLLPSVSSPSVSPSRPSPLMAMLHVCRTRTWPLV